MASGYHLYHPKYKDRDGTRRTAARWYVEFRDARGTRRRLPLYTSKTASDEAGRNLVRLVEYHKGSGGQVDPGLSRWLSGLSDALRRKLVEYGLLSRERHGAAKTLGQHLDDWSAALQAKGNTPAHVALVVGRARRVVEGCGFKFYADIQASRVAGYLGDLRADTEGKRGISAQTSNFYLTAVKQFCRWMVRDRRATDNPLSHLDGLNVKTDRRHDRRALTTDELVRLLEAARTGPERHTMPGETRYWLYRVAVETGLRLGELRSLMRASFALDGDAPTVTVLAGYSKRRREDTLPLRPETAKGLTVFLATKLPTAPAFPMPDRQRIPDLMKEDLQAAKVPYRDEAGRVADFHSLRHTFISNLAAGGVSPKVAQDLARHSTITLTMDRYTHTLVGEQSAALAVLPDLDAAAAKQAARATGTHGRVEGAAAGATPGGQGARLPEGAGRAGGGAGGKRVYSEAGPVDAGRREGGAGAVPGNGETSGMPEVSAEKGAEREGFEPSVTLPPHRFSRPNHDAGAAAGTVDTANTSDTNPGDEAERWGRRWGENAPQDPDLMLLVERWQTLPDAVRKGITAMVRAAAPTPPEGK